MESLTDKSCPSGLYGGKEKNLMLEFMVLMLVLSLLAKIPVGEAPEPVKPKHNDYENGTADAYVMKNAWEFKSLDDAMEFRELRKGGWRGNAQDYYRWKEEE